MDISREIGKPEYKTHIDVEKAINPDIRATLEKRFPEAVRYAKPIAYRYKGDTRMATLRNIYNSLKNDITYRKDPEGYQDIRMPRYFWNTKTGDCKSFSLNSLAIYHCLYPEDPLYFFYAGYYDDQGRPAKVPTHVYGLIEPKNQAPIILDGCWYFFNSEKGYTLGFKSKNMQVRTLYGIGGGPAPSRAEANAAFDKIYRSLDPQGKADLKQALHNRLNAEIVMMQHGQGEISAIDAIEELCAIEGLGKAKKHKGRGKKALHWFNTVALFLGRAAFLLFVTLNVNGLASKMAKLILWKKFDKINNLWYTLGGNQGKFQKIIQRGAKKKALFLSKKARERYETNFGGKRDATGKLISGHDDYIGVAPAIAAAALAAIPVIASLVPKMIEAFKSHPQGQADATEMANQGKDVVDSVAAQGYHPDAGTINSMLPPGESADLTAPMPEAAQRQDGAATLQADLEEEMNGIEDHIGDAGDVFAALAPALGSLAQVGMSELGKVVSKSRNKNVRAIGDGTIGIASEGFAAYAAQRAGYGADAAFLRKHASRKKGMNPLVLVGGAAVALFALKSMMSPSPAPQYAQR